MASKKCTDTYLTAEEKIIKKILFHDKDNSDACKTVKIDI